jgi:DNA mismatch endonuclease (patch repair protein)
MPDVFTKAKRSEMMSRIRGRGNKETELALARIFRAVGITGWRRHIPLVGKPDFAFREQRVAIFVDGCFWHGCPKHSNMPVNNRAFWVKKLTGNQLRDRLVTRTLRKDGWRVVRVWAHELRQPACVLARIRKALAVS